MALKGFEAERRGFCTYCNQEFLYRSIQSGRVCQKRVCQRTRRIEKLGLEEVLKLEEIVKVKARERQKRQYELKKRKLQEMRDKVFIPLATTTWWRDDAACIGKDPNLFNMERDVGETPRQHRDRMESAKRICASCPVMNECMRDAERTNSWGVIRGVSELPSESRVFRNRLYRDRICSVCNVTWRHYAGTVSEGNDKHCSKQACKDEFKRRRYLNKSAFMRHVEKESEAA